VLHLGRLRGGGGGRGIYPLLYPFDRLYLSIKGVGDSCQKVRLSQDRMPVFPPPLAANWMRGKRPFSSPPAKLG
jgi:hypothetical protein